jgi:hypothetical protein
MSAANDLDTPTGQREYKAFATLAAQYAIRGYGLVKADPAIDGQAPYYAMRWGAMARPLADLDAADDYLRELMRAGGAGHGQKLQGQ